VAVYPRDIPAERPPLVFHGLKRQQVFGKIGGAQIIPVDDGDQVVQAVMAGKTMIGNIFNILGSIGGLGQGAFKGTGVSQGAYGSTNFVNIPTNTVATPFYHSGGIVRAHNGLAVDEVPIIAQRGERILSRSQNREYEQGNGRQQQPIIVLKFWDFADVQKHEAQIVAMFGNAMQRNGQIRGIMKKYA